MIKHPPKATIISKITFAPNKHVFQVNDPHYFRATILAAKEVNTHGAFVHAWTGDEYRATKMFILNSGAAVIAVKIDGTIISVIKHPELAKRDGLGKVNRELVLSALRHGGKRLDCFDGFLPSLYAQFGFTPICRLKFNDEFAPHDWNYERDGRPDIIFMLHNFDRIDVVESKHDHNCYPPYQIVNGSVPYVNNYDEATRMINEEQHVREQEHKTKNEYKFFE